MGKNWNPSPTCLTALTSQASSYFCSFCACNKFLFCVFGKGYSRVSGTPAGLNCCATSVWAGYGKGWSVVW